MLETNISDPDPNDPVAEVREAQAGNTGPSLNWGTGVGERSDFKFFFAGAQIGKTDLPGPSRRHTQRSIRVGRQHHAASGRPTLRLRIIRPSSTTENTYLRAGGRRNLHWCQPDPGDLPLELSHPIATHSALVSGSRRPHLHHAQVSARCPRPSRLSRRHIGMEFFSAGRHRHSLLLALPADRSIWA